MLCKEPILNSTRKTKLFKFVTFCTMYSTKIFPVIFINADKEILNIIDSVKGKSGIYMWTNINNNKRYIGSSVSLHRRLLEYFNINRLLYQKSIAINVALIKYGYSSFNYVRILLEIRYYFERKVLFWFI
jgi:excinuclease UvrABC nuclease subunit